MPQLDDVIMTSCWRYRKFYVGIMYAKKRLSKRPMVKIGCILKSVGENCSPNSHTKRLSLIYNIYMSISIGHTIRLNWAFFRDLTVLRRFQIWPCRLVCQIWFFCRCQKKKFKVVSHSEDSFFGTWIWRFSRFYITTYYSAGKFYTLHVLIVSLGVFNELVVIGSS